MSSRKVCLTFYKILFIAVLFKFLKKYSYLGNVKVVVNKNNKT